MPYIEKEKRPAMDEIVALMKKNGVEANGDLNYILYAFCTRHIKPSYSRYKRYIWELENAAGEINESAKEIRRRILGPYEDIKIEKNGDVI